MTRQGKIGHFSAYLGYVSMHRFLTRIRAGIIALAPRAVIRRLESPPVLGAAFIGMDQLGASRSARTRLRTALTHRRLKAR